jgi:hypothetical protein
MSGKPQHPKDLGQGAETEGVSSEEAASTGADRPPSPVYRRNK